METASESTPKDAIETVASKETTEVTPAKDAKEDSPKDVTEAASSPEPVPQFHFPHPQDKAFIENLLSSLSVETKTQKERKQLVYDVPFLYQYDVVRDHHDGPLLQAALQLALEVAAATLP